MNIILECVVVKFELLDLADFVTSPETAANDNAEIGKTAGYYDDKLD